MVAIQGNCSKSEAIIKLENFGKFHTYQFILICLPLFMVSMTHVNYIFVAEEVSYRCRVPGCDDENATIEVPQWWPDEIDSKCTRPVLSLAKYKQNNNSCSNATFLDVIEQCDDWIYESYNSVITQLMTKAQRLYAESPPLIAKFQMNLGCDSWKSSLVGSVHNAGMIVSMMFTGWIADKFGRKPTTIICSIGGAVGIFKLFIPNFYAYLSVEFMESVLASGLYTVAIVLMIELGGETKRVMAGVIFSYAIYVGEVAFAFAALGLKHWKSLIIVVYSPLILFLSYILLLRESTRWQMLRGRMEPAKDTFKIIAKTNKLDLDDKDIENMTDADISNYFSVETRKEKETLTDIMASKEIMIRLSVTSFCFFTSSFLYYGSMVHSVLLPGNKYTNFVLAAIVSFPGDMIAFYTFNKFGRRITLQYGYISSAIFLTTQQFVPDTLSWLKLLLFLLSKLGVVVCFTGIYTYSLELFPTSVRGSLIGFGNTAARIGSMLSPLTPLLMTTLMALPSILFSTTAVLAALLLCLTPETKYLPMFDTIAQINSYKAKEAEQVDKYIARDPEGA